MRKRMKKRSTENKNKIIHITAKLNGNNVKSRPFHCHRHKERKWEETDIFKWQQRKKTQTVVDCYYSYSCCCYERPKKKRHIPMREITKPMNKMCFFFIKWFFFVYGNLELSLNGQFDWRWLCQNIGQCSITREKITITTHNGDWPFNACVHFPNSISSIVIQIMSVFSFCFWVKLWRARKKNCSQRESISSKRTA